MSQWPPDYVSLFAWRQRQLLTFRSNAQMLAAALVYYRTRPVEFICDWVDTYDPRNAGVPGKITRMPFVMFDRQRELVQFIYACLEGEAHGLVEKCRDAGATWAAVAVSVHLWRFWDGISIGWGSRKEQLVDKLGDMDSIFEKLRAVIRNLPSEFLPRGFNESEHLAYMRVLNPESGASITGEAGTNIGRGGRKRIYFKDEAQPLDEPVLTPDGWRQIGQLRPGDYVVGPDLAPVRVLGVNDCGYHPVYGVQLAGGAATRASENHRWVLLDGREVRTTALMDEVVPVLGRDWDGCVKACGRVVTAVAPLGIMDVRCITVEGGLYITRDYIITHNSAHYERPDMIEAALGDNTRVQIDVSSVNGTGNVFHRRRENGLEWVPGQPVTTERANVFVFDWRDHPDKTQAWYDERRRKAEDEGLLHIFAQEVDRDYSSSVDGVVIPREWVMAAVDAHITLGFPGDGKWIAGLDVADGGGDKNALAQRHGVVLRQVEAWGAVDTGVTTRRAVQKLARPNETTMVYDCIGVGAGVKSELNRLRDEGCLPPGLKVRPWNAGAGVLNPDKRVIPGDKDSPTNGDHYLNLKAQAWWELRARFWATYRAVTEGISYDPEDLISIDSSVEDLAQLIKELSQATSSLSPGRLKLMIDKSPDGTRSPNMADAVVMAYWPATGRYNLENIG